MPLRNQSTSRDHQAMQRHARLLTRLLATSLVILLSAILTGCQQLRDLTTTFTTQHVAGPSP